jgi:hypothetical protein
LTLVIDHYDRLLAQHYTWMLGGDLAALAAEQATLPHRRHLDPAGRQLPQAAPRRGLARRAVRRGRADGAAR